MLGVWLPCTQRPSIAQPVSHCEESEQFYCPSLLLQNTDYGLLPTPTKPAAGDDNCWQAMKVFGSIRQHYLTREVNVAL